MHEIYTDGSCATNIRKGGWGFAVVGADGAFETEQFGSAEDTTNNRMELTALIEALKYCNGKYAEGDSVTIYTDSAYIANCFKDRWYKKWLANGWRTANRQAIKNVDLWKLVLHEYRFTKLTINIEKVEGHSTCIGNIKADELANRWRDANEENIVID